VGYSSHLSSDLILPREKAAVIVQLAALSRIDIKALCDAAGCPELASSPPYVLPARGLPNMFNAKFAYISKSLALRALRLKKRAIKQGITFKINLEDLVCHYDSIHAFVDPWTGKAAQLAYCV
jgi:hypothetical protein